MNFTVIIPSRNRPVLLAQAVRSVLEQTHVSFEIIIVNDGSLEEHSADYQRIAGQSPRIRLLNLEQTLTGHGPSYAINRGAEAAAGKYLCFLDDDDEWIDAKHLERAWLVLSQNSADLFLSNQTAFVNGRPINESLWLAPLAPAIQRNAQADSNDSYPVALTDLMALAGFPHLNNTIVRRDLYQSAGGMDENIRYECEWDLYFRLVDAARQIRYFPGVVSRHNVPDKSRAANASTVVSALQKLLFRAVVMDKAMLFCRSSAIRQCAKRVKAVTYKNIATRLADAGNLRSAHTFAREALALQFGFKWLLYCVALGLRSLFSSGINPSNSQSRHKQ